MEAAGGGGGGVAGGAPAVAPWLARGELRGHLPSVSRLGFVNATLKLPAADLIHVFSKLPRDLYFIDHTSDIGWKEYELPSS